MKRDARVLPILEQSTIEKQNHKSNVLYKGPQENVKVLILHNKRCLIEIHCCVESIKQPQSWRKSYTTVLVSRMNKNSSTNSKKIVKNAIKKKINNNLSSINLLCLC